MTEQNKGEFRNLTPAEIGKAVANFRKMAAMKQITLAHEARVTERTIQRIEQGEKVNDETLRQVGQALRVKPDSFIGPQYVLNDNDARAQAEKMLSEVLIIDANDLTTLKDCAAVLDTHGYFVDDRSAGDELAHQIAVLRDTLQDWVTCIVKFHTPINSRLANRSCNSYMTSKMLDIGSATVCIKPTTILMLRYC
jgi:transcriptional regulator with XRE-family HTH domain